MAMASEKVSIIMTPNIRLDEQFARMLSELKAHQDSVLTIVQRSFDHRMDEIKERIEELKEEKSEIHKELYGRVEKLEFDVGTREDRWALHDEKMIVRIREEIQAWHDADGTYMWIKNKQTTSNVIWRIFIGALAVPTLYMIYRIFMHVVNTDK